MREEGTHQCLLSDCMEESQDEQINEIMNEWVKIWPEEDLGLCRGSCRKTLRLPAGQLLPAQEGLILACLRGVLGSTIGVVGRTWRNSGVSCPTRLRQTAAVTSSHAVSEDVFSSFTDQICWDRGSGKDPSVPKRASQLTCRHFLDTEERALVTWRAARRNHWRLLGRILEEMACLSPTLVFTWSGSGTAHLSVP